MRVEVKKHLYDLQRAVRLLAACTNGKSFAGYAAEPMLRPATGRQFEITGKAVARLARADAQVAAMS